MGAAAVGAAAAVASTGISAATALSGSGKQSSAISGASAAAQAVDAQTRATGQANYDASIANVQPYIGAGQNALMQYANINGLNGADAANAAMANFQASPGYQYQLDQGLKAVDAGAASQGLLRSGATLRAEQTLGNNLANTDFGNYVGRLNSLSNVGLQGAQLYNGATTTFDNLLSGVGTSETGTLTSAGTQQASIAGNQSKQLGDAANALIGNGLYQFKKNGLFDTGTPTTSFDGGGSTAFSGGSGSGAFNVV
jgi:hypothetical protein